MATYLNPTQINFPDPVLYTPDFSYMDKMLRRKQALYEQGFSQVAGRYNALNREMTNPENVRFRDEFLRRAVTNLKDLSSMDLSIPQNVQAASAVFDPFTQNKDAIGDMVFTSHILAQERMGDSDRQREGGKYYNPASLTYIRSIQDAYRRDTPGSVNRYLQIKPSYTPYADYSKKFMEALDKVKPNLITEQIPTGNGYFKKTTVQSYDMHSLQEILDNTLTAAEKNQIKLEGVVNRLNEFSDPNQTKILLDDYIKYAGNLTNAIDKKISEQKLKRDNASTKDKSVYDGPIANYEDQKRKILSRIEVLKTADPFQRRMILEDMAGDTYLESTINTMAESIARQDNKRELIYSPDERWLKIYEQNQINARAAADREKKEQPDLLPYQVTMGSTEKKEQSLATIQQSISELQSKINAESGIILRHLQSKSTETKYNQNHITQFIADWGVRSGQVIPVIQPGKPTSYKFSDKSTYKPGQELNAEDFRDYMTWKNYSGAVANLNLEKKSLESTMARLDNDIKQKAATEYSAIEQMASKINDGKNITFTDPTGKTHSYTPEEFYRNVESGRIKRLKSSAAGAGGDAPSIAVQKGISIDGKDFSYTDAGFYTSNDNIAKFDKQVTGYISQAEAILQSPQAQKIKKIRDDVYNSTTVENLTIRPLNPQGDLYKKTAGEGGLLSQLLPKVKLQINGQDELTGDLVFTITEKGGMSDKDIMEALKGNVTVKEIQKDTYAIQGLDNKGLLNTFNASQRSLFNILTYPQRGLEITPNTYVFTTDPFYVGDFPVFVKRFLTETPGTDGTALRNYSFYIYDQAVPESPVIPNAFSNASQVISALGELGRNPDLFLANREMNK